MSVVNPAQHLAQLPKSEVGAYAQDLAKLIRQNIPLPQTFCVPVSALRLIGHHNNLPGKIEQITQLTNPLDSNQNKVALTQIKRTIRQQNIPDQVVQTLHQFYNQQLDKNFIRLIASPVKGTTTEYKREDNIQGEANLLESILKLWARNITQENLVHHHYFPVAIVIQAQFQPEASGLAYTQHPKTGDKNKIILDSVWGVYQRNEQLDQRDRMVLDFHSYQVVDQQSQTQKEYYYRQLDQLGLKSTPAKLKDRVSLSRKQAVELAKLVRQIKLDSVQHLKIHWELVNGQLIITKIKPFQFSPDNTLIHDYATKAVLVGKSVNSGFITAQAKLIETKQDLNQFTAGQIAVVKTLNPSNQRLIHTSSAIICQHGITNQNLLNQVKKFSLPVIIQAQAAFSKLADGQFIIVDAGAGKVYLSKKDNQQPGLYRETEPKLYLAVNNPQEINQDLNKMSQGIGLLRSDHFFIEEGIHPLHLIRSQAESLKQRISREIVSYFHRTINSTGQEPLIVYRSLNLTSTQLAKLAHGQAHESRHEQNPFLGFRGAIRSLHQPEIFKFELDLIKHINKKLDKQIVLLLPFIRSPFELERLLAMVDQECEQEVTNPEIWLQLTTPENLINIDQYLQANISGLSINVKNIHSLLLGLDPANRNIFDLYQLNNQLMISLIKKVQEQVNLDHKKMTTLLNLHQFNQELVQLCQEIGIAGLTVRPNLAKQTKSALIKG